MESGCLIIFGESEHFFSDGYFVSSIGNVSQERLREYILNQGN